MGGWMDGWHGAWCAIHNRHRGGQPNRVPAPQLVYTHSSSKQQHCTSTQQQAVRASLPHTGHKLTQRLQLVCRQPGHIRRLLLLGLRILPAPLPALLFGREANKHLHYLVLGWPCLLLRRRRCLRLLNVCWLVCALLLLLVLLLLDGRCRRSIALLLLLLVLLRRCSCAPCCLCRRRHRRCCHQLPLDAAHGARPRPTAQQPPLVCRDQAHWRAIAGGACQPVALQLLQAQRVAGFEGGSTILKGPQALQLQVQALQRRWCRVGRRAAERHNELRQASAAAAAG